MLWAQTYWQTQGDMDPKVLKGESFCFETWLQSITKWLFKTAEFMARHTDEALPIPITANLRDTSHWWEFNSEYKATRGVCGTTSLFRDSWRLQSSRSAGSALTWKRAAPPGSISRLGGLWARGWAVWWETRSPAGSRPALPHTAPPRRSLLETCPANKKKKRSNSWKQQKRDSESVQSNMCAALSTAALRLSFWGN